MRRRRFAPKVYAEIRARQDNLCACGCGEPLGPDVHYDHIHQLALGGADTPDNLRALIGRHHAPKSAQDARARAKVARIQESAGLTKKRLSKRERAMRNMATKGATPWRGLVIK